MFIFQGTTTTGVGMPAVNYAGIPAMIPMQPLQVVPSYGVQAVPHSTAYNMQTVQPPHASAPQTEFKEQSPPNICK